MKLSPLTITAVLLLLIGIAAFYFGTRTRDTWQAYPEGIIVDTPEEFNRKNTP